MAKKKSKKSKAEDALPKRTVQSYEDELAEKLKIIASLEDRRDELELKNSDLQDYIDTHGSAQEDIKDFIEKKVIVKEDKIDSMIDIEEEHLKLAKQTKAELIQQIERESEELKLKLADITHTYNKTEQESSKHYETRKAKEKLSKVIDDYKETLAVNEENNAIFLYEKAKQMVYEVERNKLDMEEHIHDLHRRYSKYSKPQIKRVSQVQIINNKRLRKKLDKADKKSTEIMKKANHFKKSYQLTAQEIKVFQDASIGKSKEMFGTIPILTKQNATKAKEINDLILEYKEIEQAIEGQHSRDKLFEELNTEVEQQRLLLDVKLQDDKIAKLQEEVSSLKDYNEVIDTELQKVTDERKALESFLLDITTKLLLNKFTENDSYAILEQCTTHNLLSNSLTTDKLKSGDLGFV